MNYTKDIDKKWQEYWKEKKTFSVETERFQKISIIV